MYMYLKFSNNEICAEATLDEIKETFEYYNLPQLGELIERRDFSEQAFRKWVYSKRPALIRMKTGGYIFWT